MRWVSDCTNIYTKCQNSVPQLFQDNLLCAAVSAIKIILALTLILQNAERESCHWDSGGPLIIEKKGTFGSERFPSLHARVDNSDVCMDVCSLSTKIYINKTFIAIFQFDSYHYAFIFLTTKAQKIENQ